MTAVAAGPGMILERDPSAGLSGVRSGGPVTSQPWELHSRTLHPSAPASCSLRCTAERNGQALLHVCVHKTARKSPQQQPREGTGACDSIYPSFPARTLIPKGHFRTLESKPSGLYIGSLSASLGRAQYSCCAG